MGAMWIFLPLAVAAVGIVVFLSGIGHALRGRMARGGAGLGAGGVAAIVGLGAGLFGLNMQTYARLTFEAPVAQISVKAVDPARKLYQVALKRLDGTKLDKVCAIQGDEWELSGRVQKWKPWANVLGLNTTYTIEQMTNRYIDPAEGNGKRITACDLRGPSPKISQYLPDAIVQWMIQEAMVSHRQFGSANFMPLADGAQYRVVITQFGFNAEPINDAAKAVNDRRPITAF